MVRGTQSHARSSAPVVLAAAALACWTARSVSTLFTTGQLAASHVGLHAQSQLASPASGALASVNRRVASIIARRAEETETAAKESANETDGVRVGVMYVPGVTSMDFKAIFEKKGIKNTTYFETEVPDAMQLPMAAKFLAMSQTVDVIVLAAGVVGDTIYPELVRAYQSVALNTNVPIVPCEPSSVIDKVADVAVQMGEIRQQALMGAGVRKSTFFGIGKNESAGGKGEKKKIYF